MLFYFLYNSNKDPTTKLRVQRMDIPMLTRDISLKSSQQYQKLTYQTLQESKEILKLSSIQFITSPRYLGKSAQIHNKPFASANILTDRINNFYNDVQFCEKHLCITHKKKYTYECLICKQNVCTDCLTDSRNHRGHRFQRFNQQKQDMKAKYKQLKEQLKFKIIQISKIKQIAQNRIKFTVNEKQLLQFQRLNHYKLKLQAKTDQLLEQFSSSLLSYKNIFNQFNQYYDACLFQLKNTNRVALIQKTGALIQNSLNQKIKQVKQISVLPVKNKDLPHIKPNGQINIFAVQNFTQIRLTTNEKILQSYEAFKSIWRLKIYPAGYSGAKVDQKHKGVQYASIYLERMSGALQKCEFTIQIQITSRVDPTLKIKKQFLSTFSRNQSWGYDRYTRLSNIYNHGFLGDDDTLFIKVSINPTNYYQICQALNQKIIEKQKLQSQNERRIKILKIMIENKRNLAKKVLEYKKQQMKQYKKIKKAKLQSQKQIQNSLIMKDEEGNSFRTLEKFVNQQNENKIPVRTSFLQPNNKKQQPFQPIDLEKPSSNKSIKLVPQINNQLIENSNKKLHNRSNTFY